MVLTSLHLVIIRRLKGVILGTGYPKLEIFGYSGTRKQFCKTHKYSWMYKITNMRHNKCGPTVIISSLYTEQLVASPFPTQKKWTKNWRLPLVWLKCSVKIFKSCLWVIGTKKWNRVMTVSVDYPGSRYSVAFRKSCIPDIRVPGRM